MRSSSGLWIPGLLLVILLVQFGACWRLRRPQPPTGPVTGEVLPATLIETLDGDSEQQLADLLTGKGTCSLLVIISTNCHFCSRMRSTWPKQVRLWSDSVGTSIRLAWLSGEEREPLNVFFDGYDFRGIVLARITAEPARALSRLGVFGTPTTYMLDRAGRLRLGVMGDRLPPSATVRAACQ